MARFGSLKTNNLYIGRSGTLYSESPAQVTATAAQLNAALNNTATVAEVNLLDNVWDSFTTVETGASGSCGIQLVFKDAAGVTMATPVAGTFYISDVATGLEVDILDTGAAVLTNGAIDIVNTGVTSHYNFVTSAAGLLGVTITSGADSHWLCFIHPTGKLVISDECIIDA